MYDIIIRAGRQGDGQLVDIAIREGKIAAIGSLPETATADAPAKTLTEKQDDALLAVLNRFTNPQYYWSGWVALIWGALLVVRGLRLFVFGEWIKNWRQARLQRLLRK